MAIGEWHHEADKETNRSLPAGFGKDCFKSDLISASSGAVSSIKFSACTCKGPKVLAEDVYKRNHKHIKLSCYKSHQNQTMISDLRPGNKTNVIKISDVFATCSNNVSLKEK